jgi:hypothetical protein
VAYEPYLVLGVPETANAVDIKKAYHRAVWRCHPDRFTGKPEYESAQEELKRINLAYGMLAPKMKGQAAGGAARQEPPQEPGWQQQSDCDAHFMRMAYEMAMARRTAEALLMLSKCFRRGAQWHYVHSVCMYKKGALADAIGDIEIAMKLEPANGTYRDHWRTVVAQKARIKKRVALAGAAAAAAVVVIAAATL